MPDDTANLSLPYLLQAQAQPHVTHNEALQILDALVQLSVLDRTRLVPPADPKEGARHIVPAGATGDWAGQEGMLALRSSSAWTFLAPRPGWRAFVQDEAADVVWHGGAWQALPPPDLDNLAGIGVGTAADPVNRLAVAAEATLFSHAGAGHQLKINKAAPGDTASLLLQSGWSGRAEMGLAGNDDFAIKVSADGAAWTDALRFDAATGAASGAAVQSGPQDLTPGRLLTVGAVGTGGTAAGNPAGGNDLNAHLSYGMADVTAGTLNAPFAGSGVCLALPRNAGRVVQICAEITGQNETHLYVRTLGATWGQWVPLTPERGSNANGAYVRFADGTQICWFTKSTTDDLTGASGGLYWAQQGVTFPAPFSAPPVVTPNAIDVSSGLYWGSISGNPTATGFTFQAVGTTNGGTYRMTYTAIGRWY